METIFALSLFIIYLSLWSIKRFLLIKKEKIDPKVLGKSTSNIQKYMNAFSKVMMVYIVILIPLHAFNIHWYILFERFTVLDTFIFDIIGFGIGLIGLSFCLYAQIKMGKSWRVGIDTEKRTELITTGLYSLIRNPTYLGLFLLCIGVWLILPTVTIFMFCAAFILFLEIQVRCEEDFLENVFDEEYVIYKRKTKRYIPFLY